MVFKDKSLLQVGSVSPGYAAKNIVARNNKLTGWLGLKSGGTTNSVASSDSVNSEFTR